MTARLHEREADAQPASGSRSVKDLLTRRDGEGPLIQGLCPIVESVAWLRSQRYWEQAGANVFTSGEVPYIVTNDGDQSSKAVDLYVRSLRAAEQRRCRPNAKGIHYVLEFGIGTGPGWRASAPPSPAPVCCAPPKGTLVDAAISFLVDRTDGVASATLDALHGFTDGDRAP